MDKLLLLPDDSKNLKNKYLEVFKNADEIFFANAFLLKWPFEPQDLKCKKLTFIIGEGFRLTRKNEAKKLQDWLGSTELLISNKGSSFHPKILAWKKGNKYFVLVGSSNMTHGGQENNLEANACIEIKNNEWMKLKDWFKNLVEDSQGFDSWFSEYKESKIEHRNNKIPKRKNIKLTKKIELQNDVLRIMLRDLNSYLEHRNDHHLQKRKNFNKGKKIYIKTLRFFANTRNNENNNSKCFDQWGKIRGSKCDSNIQSLGYIRDGKSANWIDASQSILAIIDATSDSERDDIVEREMDFLDKKKNSLKKAWLTELLCQLYPDEYLLFNFAAKPLNKIISGHRGLSFGKKYVYLCKTLRRKMKNNQVKVGSIKIKNFLELDAALYSLGQENKVKK